MRSPSPTKEREENRNAVQQGVEGEVEIDFPKVGDRITASSYTFRIGAGSAENVEIAIDEGAWLPCRPAAGYWWFDWSDYKPGGE